MRRLGYFLSGLPLGAKLQFLALGMILGLVFINRDLNPRMQWFGLPLWQITVPLILGVFVLGRLLLPLMMWQPKRAQGLLRWLGMLVLGIGLLSMFQWWGRLLIVHVGLTTAMWLDASCWFWFISEIQKRTVAMSDQSHDPDEATDEYADADSEFEDEEDLRR
ncbi:MAG: hypothetical protein JSS49_00390 [Planctomycetes bacterium]|nr:hypothetical protein [Planctomycetota bacterium]